jgi:hypothetical protein
MSSPFIHLNVPTALGMFTSYIGGRKINGTFKWINGDDMPTSLDYWYYNPSIYDGSNKECVAIGNSYHYTYNEPQSGQTIDCKHWYLWLLR